MALAIVADTLLGESPSARAQDYRAAATTTRSSFDSARSETRVDRADAERVATENVGDLLSQAEGLVVSRTSSVSAVPIIRGLTGSSVLLMVDELRLNDSLTRPGGNALLNLIDPESVRDIEVVRGPASVLYGSDALGGVVRVRTKQLATGPEAESYAAGTIYGRGAVAERAVRGSAAVEGVYQSFGARLSGGRGHAGLLLRGGGLGEQPFTGHDDATFAGRLELTPSKRHSLTISHQSGHLWDVPRSDVSTEEDRQSTLSLARDAVVLSYAGDLPEQSLQVRAFSGMVLRRELRERLRNERVEHEYDGVLGYQFGAAATLLLDGGASLELGTDAVLERVSSSSSETAASGDVSYDRGRYVGDSSYDMAALFALWSQPFAERWTLLAGVRGTLINAEAPLDPLFDRELQERLDQTLVGPAASLGARLDVSSELSIMLSLLTGFRAPNLEDFQAFGGGARGFTIPNPNLHEERAWTLESGFKFRRSELQASLFVFGSLLRGQIVRVPGSWGGDSEIDGEPVLQRENASRSVMVGGEAELRASFQFGLYTAAAFWAVWGETRRPDESGDELTEPATKIPGPAAALRVGYERSQSPYWAEAAAGFQLPQTRLSEGDRLDVRLCPDGPDACERVDGYVDITLRAGLRLDPGLTFTIALENLLDRAYRTYASGAYAPGRNLVLGLRMSL
ncbi:MAG TPA: TonB-dependent receptor [Polyangiales bacterium]|nr:TonB-dependent receptor [Polyangiales bacterium]